MEKIRLFDLDFSCVTLTQMINELRKIIESGKKTFIQTVNVDHLILMQEDRNFREITKSADYITCDGTPILWVSKLKKRKLPERVTGADLTLEICRKSAVNNFKIFILGAAPQVAEKAKREAKRMYPNVMIKGCYSPEEYELKDEEKNEKICKMINRSGANILLIALGAPKQEKWYWENRGLLKVNVAIGVGAAIDFLAKEKRRAPAWIGKIGLEWLYRLLHEPKRLWKRYLVRDMRFIPLLVKEVLKIKQV